MTPVDHLAGALSALREKIDFADAIRIELEAELEAIRAETSDLRVRLENIRTSHAGRGRLLNLARGQLRFLHGWNSVAAVVDHTHKEPERAGTALLVDLIEAELATGPVGLFGWEREDGGENDAD